MKLPLKNAKTRNRLVQCLVEQLLASGDAPQAESKLVALEQTDGLAHDQLKRIRDTAATNPTLFDDVNSRRRINALFAKHGVEPIQVKTTADDLTNDNTPF